MSSRKADEEVFWRKAIRVFTKGTALLVVFCAFAISMVNLFGLLPELEWLKERERTVNLLLWASIVLYLLPRTEDLLSSIKEKESYVNQALCAVNRICTHCLQLGVQAIYKSRVSPGQQDTYKRLISEASEDLLIVAITLTDMVDPDKEQRSVFYQKVPSDECSLRMLIVNPKFWANTNPVIYPVAPLRSPTAGVSQPGDLRYNFSEGITRLVKLANDISDEIRGKDNKGYMEVRFYNVAPTLTLTIADKAKGHMRLELSPYNVPDSGLPYFRPLIDLRPIYNGDLYSEFYQRYEKLWHANSHQTFIRVDSQRPDVNWNLIDPRDQEVLGVGPRS